MRSEFRHPRLPDVSGFIRLLDGRLQAEAHRLGPRARGRTYGYRWRRLIRVTARPVLQAVATVGAAVIVFLAMGNEIPPVGIGGQQGPVAAPSIVVTGGLTSGLELDEDVLNMNRLIVLAAPQPSAASPEVDAVVLPPPQGFGAPPAE